MYLLRASTNIHIYWYIFLQIYVRNFIRRLITKEKQKHNKLLEQRKKVLGMFLKQREVITRKCKARETCEHAFTIMASNNGKPSKRKKKYNKNGFVIEYTCYPDNMFESTYARLYMYPQVHYTL